MWIILGVCVVGAVSLLVLVDRMRGPIKCGACGEPLSGLFSMRKVNGKRVRVCRSCDARLGGS